MSPSDNPVPRPPGWTDEMVAQLEGAIASEVQRQVRELLDDPERLATLLDYALRHQRAPQDDQERHAS